MHYQEFNWRAGKPLVRIEVKHTSAAKQCNPLQSGVDHRVDWCSGEGERLWVRRSETSKKGVGHSLDTALC